MSVSKLAKQRGVILDEIMRYHRQELPKTMRELPLENLRALAAVAPPPLDFYTALKAVPGVALIAECKKASPSKGLLVPHYDPVELARTYVRAGAAAISVLTDARHFQGSLGHLRDVKESLSNLQSLISNKSDRRLQTGVPVLRKDFVFHPYQVYEARVAGADAVLLIAAVLSNTDLRDLLKLTHDLGMNALIEVHTEGELERVLPLRPRLIGINNRNLQTFEIDLGTTVQLRPLIPADILVVSESGIKTADDVRRLRDTAVDAVLVGETLVKSKDVYETTRALARAA